MKAQSIAVRIASNAAEREAAFRIRYEVYVEEMGWETEYANHDTRLLEQPLDAAGKIWIAVLDEEIIGTVRINIGSGCEIGHYGDIYSIDSLPESHGTMVPVGIVTNFVMRRAYRNLTIAMQLVRAVFAMAVRAGVRIMLLDCEPKMARLYAWIGFEIHIADFVHPQYGPGICMKMDVHNWIDRFMTPELKMAA